MLIGWLGLDIVCAGRAGTMKSVTYGWKLKKLPSLFGFLFTFSVAPSSYAAALSP